MTTLPTNWTEGGVEDVSTINDCYCPACEGGKATTTMLPTNVPFFREIIIMTLTCPDCAFRNSEVSFGGRIQDRGERITLRVTTPEDLNRQLVKSDSATFAIPQIEFEIPPTTQRGSMSTIEGMLRRAVDNLEQSQPKRLRLDDIDNFHRCRAVIEKLKVMSGLPLEGESQSDSDSNVGQCEESGVIPSQSNAEFEPYEIVLDDPAGNSFIENPHAPAPDPQMQKHMYYRSPKQDMMLGLQPSKEAIEAGTIDDANPTHKNVVNAAQGQHMVEIDSDLHFNKSDIGRLNAPMDRQEAITFQTTCPNCHRDTETAMCTVDLPHFKEVIIMSMFCEECGYRSNEIKAGGGVPKMGTKITLVVNNAEDLAREVLKSDSAGVCIPEIDLTLEEGGLDGVYTTVEGLIKRMYERLLSASNPFSTGDSAVKQHRSNDGVALSPMSPSHLRYSKFLEKLKGLSDGKVFPFHIIIDDPLSNSFVGPVPKDATALVLRAEKEGNNVCYGNYTDASIAVEEYTRSYEQNETLGLNDMKTENYASAEIDMEEKLETNGTDAFADLPDRLQRLDPRGPDHPNGDR